MPSRLDCCLTWREADGLPSRLAAVPASVIVTLSTDDRALLPSDEELEVQYVHGVVDTFDLLSITLEEIGDRVSEICEDLYAMEVVRVEVQPSLRAGVATDGSTMPCQKCVKREPGHPIGVAGL